MSGLASFASELLTQLAADLDIAFVPGVLIGPIESRDLGSCYAQRVAEVSGRVQEEELLAIVRVFRQYQAPVDPETPYDPAPLYDLVDQLQASVQANQVGVGGTWFLRLIAADVDPNVQGVEAQIVARALNPGL